MNMYIDKDAVIKTASSMSSNCEDFNTQIDNFLLTIEKLETVWSGADAKKHITALKEECVSELNRFHDIVNEYITYLQNVPSCYETLDTVFANKKISNEGDL